jgi:hypothetical protein
MQKEKQRKKKRKKRKDGETIRGRERKRDPHIPVPE